MYMNVASITNQWTKMLLTSFAVSFFVTFVVSLLGLLGFCEFSETVLITARSLQSSLSSDDVYNNHQHLQHVAKATWCSPNINSTSLHTVVCMFINNSLLCLHMHVTVTRSSDNELECGPMPNVMAALPNIGGALCSTPQSLADAQYCSALQ